MASPGVASSAELPHRPGGQQSIGRQPSFSWMHRLGLRPSIFYYLLAFVLVVLVVYPFGILVVSSFFTGQPGRFGTVTLDGYRVWLEAGELLPVLANSILFSLSRLIIGLTFALMFAWAVARTNVPFPGLMTWLISVPFF